MLGVRWTIGDVRAEGFEALRLSVRSAHRSFGEAAAYTMCVDTIPLSTAALALLGGESNVRVFG